MLVLMTRTSVYYQGYHFRLTLGGGKPLHFPSYPLPHHEVAPLNTAMRSGGRLSSILCCTLTWQQNTMYHIIDVIYVAVRSIQSVNSSVSKQKAQVSYADTCKNVQRLKYK